MSDCFLNGYGRCGGGMSREHYISLNVLEAISSNGGIQIAGFPWQEANSMETIGINSLVSKILCRTHNSGLDSMDTEAGRLFKAINAADKHPHELPPNTLVDGQTIERWFLKIICGLIAGARIGDGVVPDQWKAILKGAPWPDGWGLSVQVPSGQLVLSRELSVETKVHPETRAVLAATFRVGGVCFNLLLGRPDDPAAWGIYKPRGLIFRVEGEEVSIEFAWPFVTEEAVIYTKIGST